MTRPPKTPADSWSRPQATVPFRGGSRYLTGRPGASGPVQPPGWAKARLGRGAWVQRDAWVQWGCTGAAGRMGHSGVHGHSGAWAQRGGTDGRPEYVGAGGWALTGTKINSSLTSNISWEALL